MHPDPRRPIGVFCNLSPDGCLFMIAAIASGRPIVALDSFANRELNISRIKAAGCCGFLGLEDVCVSESSTCWVDPDETCDDPVLEVAADDPCLICFTSGSTGSLGVMQTVRTMVHRFHPRSLQRVRGADPHPALHVPGLHRGHEQHGRPGANGSCVVLPARRSVERARGGETSVHMVSLVPTTSKSIRVSQKVGFPDSARDQRLRRSHDLLGPPFLETAVARYVQSSSATNRPRAERSRCVPRSTPSRATAVPLGEATSGVDLQIVDDAGLPVPPVRAGP